MEPDKLILLAAVFTLAGFVKGVIGLGMPSISLALLTAAFGLPQAMALMVVPTVVTNLWQGLVGGHAWPLTRRLWSFLLIASGMVWVGGLALGQVDAALLSMLLGVLLIVYASVGLRRVRLVIPVRHEQAAGLILGALNGVFTGMTGSSVVPGVMYLQAIGLPRDMLVQAMGLLFTLSTVALALALHGNSILTPDLAMLSALATIPAFVGILVGQAVRVRVSEERFRTVFYIALLLLGTYICATPW